MVKPETEVLSWGPSTLVILIPPGVGVGAGYVTYFCEGDDIPRMTWVFPLDVSKWLIRIVNSDDSEYVIRFFESLAADSHEADTRRKMSDAILGDRSAQKNVGRAIREDWGIQDEEF